MSVHEVGAGDFEVVLAVLVPVAFVPLAAVGMLLLLLGAGPGTFSLVLDADGDAVIETSAWMMGTDMKGPYSDVGSWGMSRRFAATGNVRHAYSRRTMRVHMLRESPVNSFHHVKHDFTY